MTTLDAILRNRLIDKKELRSLVVYSPSQIYRMEKQGLFPKRRQIGPCRVAWSYAEVLEWIDCKKQGREWAADTSSGTATHA